MKWKQTNIEVNSLVIYNLLVDCRNQRLIDDVITLRVAVLGQKPTVAILSLWTISDDTDYHRLLREFPESCPSDLKGIPKKIQFPRRLNDFKSQAEV